jgi:uncharacterized protein (TIGR03663 family)
MDGRTWQLASGFVLLVAAIVRLYALELNPLHHDEGVNGFFLIKLINHGVYQYDPANYHGPTLYYFALVAAKLFKLAGTGLSIYAIRVVPVAFGVATVWLVLTLRRRLGAVGALAGASLVALSPGAVYMSRYFIHESLFVFFTLGIVVAALRFYESASFLYLMLAAASAALLFATKETAMISAGVLLIALAMTALYMGIRRTARHESQPVKQGRQKKKQRRRAHGAEHDALSESLTRFGGPLGIATLTLSALILFVLVYVLFYSSFLTHAQGIRDSLKTFEIWARTGKKEHVHEWYTYLHWLWLKEAPLLVLGVVGILLAFWRGRNSVAVFVALWATGIIAAYSLIPYKTPWLALNFIVPLAIIGGYGLGLLYRWGTHDLTQRVLAIGLAVAALSVCAYQMIELNFKHYDDDGYIYPYAHTVREILPLVDAINRFAATAGTGRQTAINITSPEYWPLPWYLRDYTRVGYAGRIAVADEPLVIGSDTQELELEAALGDRYTRIDSYQLRPGVTLVLFARNDLVKR